MDTSGRTQRRAGEECEDGGLHHEKQLRDGECNVYIELWNACAGPLVSVPRVGERVYYFPQGHIEQVEASTGQGPGPPMPTYDLPWKILCRVVNVQLKAEHSTDEVFAQLALQPEQEGTDAGQEVVHGSNLGPKFSFFSKILTASDTSTHGGFSVLKRHADECLPALDMTQLPPMQDLVAKDLHDNEWYFRHIFRGQPKRHLLTTGWSAFVGSKKLVAGDVFIFIRGENGELRVGIRKALRNQNIGAATVMSSQSMKIGLLAAAFHSISTGTMFTVYYWPRRSPSEFVVTCHRYMKSISNSYMTGTRFHMKSENEDGVGERSAGTIVGIEDDDPKRWPSSKWRCLKVQWDDSSSSSKPERVSPWEIEVFEESLPGSSSDSMNNRVLQGQDNSVSELKTNKSYKQRKKSQTLSLIWKHHSYPDNGRRANIDFQKQVGQLNWSNQSASSLSLPSNDPSPPTGGRIIDVRPGATAYSLFDASPLHPVSCSFNKQKISMEQSASGRCKIFGVNLIGDLSPTLEPDELLTSNEVSLAASRTPNNHDQIPWSSKRLPSSTYYADDVIGGSHSCQAVIARSGIKVHKQGTALGRSIDLSKFEGYGPLLLELDRMFEFHGSLADESKGWHIMCLDKYQEAISLKDYSWKLSI